MRKFYLIAIIFVAVFALAPAIARAQGAAKQGPEVMRDSDLEKDSLHNLEVAWGYFKLKKAYVAALQRCEEIIAGNPTFSKIDKALFIAGEGDDAVLDLPQGTQIVSYRVVSQDGHPVAGSLVFSIGAVTGAAPPAKRLVVSCRAALKALTVSLSSCCCASALRSSK